MMLSVKCHTWIYPLKMINVIKCITKMSAVDVEKEQKGMRRTLCPVTSLRNNASASKGSEGAETSVNAWAVRTHMEKRLIKNQNKE